MKGLIFSITAGQGHNQTAKVLSEYFNAIGVQCSYMDVFAALKVSRTYPLDDAVVQMFSGGRSLLIQEAMKSLGKPNATRDLAVFVKDIVTGGRRDE